MYEALGSSLDDLVRRGGSKEFWVLVVDILGCAMPHARDDAVCRTVEGCCMLL